VEAFAGVKGIEPCLRRYLYLVPPFDVYGSYPLLPISKVGEGYIQKTVQYTKQHDFLEYAAKH